MDSAPATPIAGLRQQRAPAAKALRAASAVLPWLWALPAVAGVPRMVLEPARLDFGRRGHNERASAKLVIRNRGDAELQILELEPSCSCTEVSPRRPGPVPPGQSIELTVTMSSGRAMGRLDKHLSLRTNDPQAPSVAIPVAMAVLEEFQMAPLQAQFSGSVGEAAVEQELELSRRSGRGPFELRFERFEDLYGAKSAAHLSARVVASDKGQKLVIRLDPAHPEGRIAANLHGVLDGRALLVPISGEMFAWIHLDTRFVNFSGARAAERASLVREVRLRSIDGTPFSVTELKAEAAKGSAPAQLECSSVAAPSRLAHRVVVRLSPEGATAANSSFYGRIRVRTDHPRKPELELQYSGFFKPK